MNRVFLTNFATTFRYTSTKEIVETSYMEHGWIENVNDRILISSLKYGFDFKAL